MSISVVPVCSNQVSTNIITYFDLSPITAIITTPNDTEVRRHLHHHHSKLLLTVVVDFVDLLEGFPYWSNFFLNRQVLLLDVVFILVTSVTSSHPPPRAMGPLAPLATTSFSMTAWTCSLSFRINLLLVEYCIVTDENLGQKDKQTERMTNTNRYRVAPQLKIDMTFADLNYFI